MAKQTTNGDAGGSLSDKDNEALALRVADNQDRDAAGILATRFAPKLTGYLMAHFGSLLREDGVEEAVQDAFVKMLKYIKSFDPRAATFEAWMIRLAYNAALDMLKLTRKHTYEVFDDEPAIESPNRVSSDSDHQEDLKIQVLENFIENKLKGFEQAVARAFIATGGDIDTDRLIQEWRTTRNHFDVAKSKVKKKFREELESAK